MMTLNKFITGDATACMGRYFPDDFVGGRSMTSFKQGLMFKDVVFSVHDVMIYQKKNTPFMRSNAYTNAGDLVFDPMCGSGTTCKMAQVIDRNWLGIDISQEYRA